MISVFEDKETSDYFSIFDYKHEGEPGLARYKAVGSAAALGDEALIIQLQVKINQLQGVTQNMSDFVFLHFSQQINVKKQNLMVPSNSLLNSVHENVQKLFPCWKNNQVISIFPRGLKTPQNTSHPPWKPCLGGKGTIHLFSQLKQ